MAKADVDDVERMTTALFIERGWRSRTASRFWVLLVLAAVIATAGLIADSTATVIGAMIVAPLMTPILGTALAAVLSDRAHLLRSLGLVVGGALLVVAIAYVMGLTNHSADAYLGNSQVAARTSPRLIDLVAALATGAVGAFALVRSDISDTLPGVAIAISLVPPLGVVGLLLEVHRYHDAGQAALLFGTNVAAILATGVVVFLGYNVRETARAAGVEVHRLSGATLLAIAGFLVLILIPLTAGTLAVLRDQQLGRQARPVVEEWARQANWEVSTVDAVNGTVIVTALGPPPEADVADLRADLNERGMGGAGLEVRLVVGGIERCPAGGTTCVGRVGGS
ncbi:MAG TPA: DUF389 domain-containing protein [Actinomycetes bacterium]|nr:DUF389 domain-containing protein [Actinomycetes bacterium]